VVHNCLRFASIFVLLILLTDLTNSSIRAQSAVYGVHDIAPSTRSDTQISYFTRKINNIGNVTGFKHYFSSNDVVAQFWTGGLEFPAGGSSSNGLDVIPNGEHIVGRGNFPGTGGGTRAYTFSPSSQNLHWLPCPVFTQFGEFCEPYAINANGQIVGSSDPRSLYPESVEAGSRALLWDGGATEIFPGSPLVSIAYDINSSGSIAGMIGYQPFIKTGSGGLILLGELSNQGSVGAMVFAKAINDGGNVVGGHTLNAKGMVQRSFYWNGTTATDIGHLGIASIPPGSSTPVVEALDINSSDQAVGGAIIGFDGNGIPMTHAFIWDPQNGIRDLNNLISPTAGIVLTKATGINDDGNIVAEGHSVGNYDPVKRRGYILKVPENPLIFVPGISGSTLYEADNFGMPIKNQESLWPDGVFHPIANPLQKLYLDTPPNQGTPIVAVDALEQVVRLGRVFKDVYKSLFDELKSHGYVRYDINHNPKKRKTKNDGGVCDGSYSGRKPNFFVFAYDWRKSNAEAAAELKKYIACVNLFYPGKKVNILTHSMGGLVARRYLLDHQGDQRVDKLITTVAPFLGAPKAIDIMKTGRFLPGWFFYPYQNVIRRMTNFAPAVHELLPSEWYYDLGERPYQARSPFRHSITSYSYNEAANLLDDEFESFPYVTNEIFHSYPNETRGQDNWSFDSSGVKFFHFYGVKNRDDTTGEVVKAPFVDYGLSIKERKFGLILNSVPGDGTVPETSARRARPNVLSILTAPSAVVKKCRPVSSDDEVEHSDIMLNPVLWEQIRGALDEISIPSEVCSNEGPGFADAQGVSKQLSGSTFSSNLLRIYSVDRLEIVDGLGNTNTPIGNGFDEAVSEIEYEYGSEPDDDLVIPHQVTFDAGKAVDIKFVVPAGKIRIEIDQRTNNTNTESVKYMDLQLPKGVMARLRFNQLIGEPRKRHLSPKAQSLSEEVENLKYDSNGDGTFDTEVMPTFALSGLSANDRTPPNIGVSYVRNGSIATVTVNASDVATGINQIRYIVQGNTIDSVYTSPFQVDVTTPKLLHVSAEDNAGNRGLYSMWLRGNSVPFDYDADGLADISVYRPTDGTWWIRNSITSELYTTEFGELEDQIAPADYDGDGKTDVAIFRPGTGDWWVLNSQTQTLSVTNWGIGTDVIVPGEYGTDGKADFAIWRPSDGGWYVKGSDGTYSATAWGIATDKPVAADYDGDGKFDLTIFRADGNWWTINSITGATTVKNLGIATDKLVPADYTGDGKADVAIWRPSDGGWWYLDSTTGAAVVRQWGIATDIPAPADYNGNGITDLAVFRPNEGNWWIFFDNNTTTAINWGTNGDIPTPNAYVR